MEGVWPWDFIRRANYGSSSICTGGIFGQEISGVKYQVWQDIHWNWNKKSWHFDEIFHCMQQKLSNWQLPMQPVINKANLRDLIAATGQVISNWIQIVNFSARVTAKFDGWPRKTIGHFFYTTSSFVHHFKSIGEFKLDLQSRNAQFGSKLVICYPVWPLNLMEDLGKQ